MSPLLKGILIILLINILWVLASELTEYLFMYSHFQKPFLITYVNSIVLSLSFLNFYVYKTFIGIFTYFKRRLNSYERLIENHNTQNEYSTFYIFGDGVIKLAPIFGILYFVQNYSYALALYYSTPSLVNVISSTSCIFVIFVNLGAQFFWPQHEYLVREKKICLKLFFACLNIVGVVLITKSTTESTKPNYNNNLFVQSQNITPLYDLIPRSNIVPGWPPQCIFDLGKPVLTPETSRFYSLLGTALALIGAFSYSFYSTLIQFHKGHTRNAAYLLTLAGLWACVLTWPFFIALHSWCIERFSLTEIRVNEWLLAIGLAFLGTAIPNTLYAQATILTSPLIVSLGVSLSIPMTLAYDLIINHFRFSWLFYIGGANIIISFLAITYLSSIPQ